MKAILPKPDAVRELTLFALRRKGTCFDGWEPPIVFRYMAWHFLAGTLHVVREGRAILGIAVAYPTDLAYLQEHENKPFDWKPAPVGNALFIGEVIVSTKRAIPILWGMAMDKFKWITTIFTYRRKRLVQIHFCHLNRLAGKEWR